ncbi:ABC transporter substrate-binding protein [Actinopolymorpha pittospori]
MPAGTGTSRGFVSRRRILQAGAGGLAAVSAWSLTGCDLLSTDPSKESGEQATTKEKEAPALAAQVKAGKLPPLKDRLPAKPVVVQTLERPGSYGGTWTLFEENPPINAARECGYDYLVRWSPDWTKILPNLAESWEIGNGGREYTFHLREGVRWSDGEPFTADDLKFAFDDVVMNKELFPAPPSLYTSGGKPGRLDKIDDHTVRFVFDTPHGLFLTLLASAGAHELLSAAKHHFSQFHPKYNPDVEALAKKEGFASWVEMFPAKGAGSISSTDFWQPEVPNLFAWRTARVAEQGQRLVLERNPYYWKTDPDGRQLPYLDGVTFVAVTNLETALLQSTDGQFDLLVPTFTGGICTVRNKPVLARSRESGDYRFIEGVSSSMNYAVIAFNLAHKDQNLRQVFQNKDFRIGLSHAINRPEIIKTVFQRQGEPWQAAPRKESDLYSEKLAKQYTAYDPATANEHLDKAGLTRRDSAGFRLRPDGKRLFFQVDVVTQEPNQISTVELIKGYWKAVGIDINVNTMDRDLFYTRKASYEPDASVWTGDGGLADALIDPRWYVPVTSESNYAIAWSDWYNSDGTAGQEPPEDAQRQMAIYDQIRVEPDPDKQRTLLVQLLESAAEHFWVIGVALPVGTFGLVKNDFHNVPKSMIASYRYLTPGPTHPEQYFTSAT